MKKQMVTTGQKLLILLVLSSFAIIGFMIKLPSAFRHIDKELHAAFYFLAAAVLNILFAGTNLFRHILIFVTLYLFGMGIELAQEYSNRFVRRRIHGRFDPEDIQWNLKGLIAFSLLWLLFSAGLLLYRKATQKENEFQ